MKRLLLSLLLVSLAACSKPGVSVAWTIRPTAHSGSNYTNGPNAYDNNVNTYASGSGGATMTLSGFSNQGASNNAVLTVILARLAVSGATCDILYSINGGTDWTEFDDGVHEDGFTWTHTLNVPPVLNTSQIQFKITSVGETSIWQVNEVSITGENPSVPFGPGIFLGPGGSVL